MMSSITSLNGEERLTWKGFLGHNQGQTFVRVNAPVRAYDSHRWTIMQDVKCGERPDYSALPTVNRGWHAHYYLASARHWFEKFVKHNYFPMHWPGAKPIPLEASVRIWREAAQLLDKSDNEVNGYCESNVFVGDQIEEGISRGELYRNSQLGILIRQSLLNHRKCKSKLKIESVDFSDLGGAPAKVVDVKFLNWSPHHNPADTKFPPINHISL